MGDGKGGLDYELRRNREVKCVKEIAKTQRLREEPINEGYKMVVEIQKVLVRTTKWWHNQSTVVGFRMKRLLGWD